MRSFILKFIQNILLGCADYRMNFVDLQMKYATALSVLKMLEDIENAHSPYQRRALKSIFKKTFDL